MSTDTRLRGLSLHLHGHLIGYLLGYRNGRNVLTFDDGFRNDPHRPTASIITHPNAPGSQQTMAAPITSSYRLHPMLSNLLPEGSLRELLINEMEVRANDEFSLFAHLGNDLPGALIARHMNPTDVPAHLLGENDEVQAFAEPNRTDEGRFSLAGVQEKYSMKATGDRYTITNNGQLGDWIVKTPSRRHPHVPENEYTGLALSRLLGITVPETKLIPVQHLENLPNLDLDGESLAFGIKRFDREGDRRIHMEDFAQVLVAFPSDKYTGGNYEQIANIVFKFSAEPLQDLRELTLRLLTNILLANGDAHLKNWSLLYQDTREPRLSPAYDVLTTMVYMRSEDSLALNMARRKQWSSMNFEHFKRWADKAGVPARAVRGYLQEGISRARDLWPDALKDLPMDDSHKTALIKHWKGLHDDFTI